MNYTSDDAQLFYTTAGRGPDVVLLHPTPCDHRFWLKVVESLSGKYRVILPDLRGHGHSETGNGPITIQKLGADIVKLLDGLGIQRALFAGCSIGGYVLYELWREAPARVSALAFCCSRPQADTEVNRAKREEWIARIRQRGTGEFVNAMIESLIGPTARQRSPERIGEVREMMRAVKPEAVIAVQQGLAARPDSVETARGIHVPSFVLASGEDGASTPADMKLLAESIRNAGYGAEYHLLRDAGHFAPWEQPQLVGRLLRRFFDSVID
ncbi:MAG: alpha/beta fold hydrolase [Silvibacterium sp.]|nr:alpha/beta fold hydrolase [Silvibacterium sp.]